MSFTHLHVHTQYSLLDGSNKIKEYVQRVKELGMSAAAITDHGVMYGVIDFYKECQKQGIKPILGSEVYVAPHSRFDKEQTGRRKYYHLVLLASNAIGYQNLMKLVSLGFTDGYYYKPRVDKESLAKYSEGIIALSACLAGEVQYYLKDNQIDLAKKAALEYDAIFGRGNFYLEMQDHGYPEQKLVNDRQRILSKETGIPLVVTNDIHYTYGEDAKAHDVLLCIQTGKRLSDENRMRYPGGQFYCKSEEDMRALFPSDGEAIDNSGEIAKRCNVEITFGEPKLPKFQLPPNIKGIDYLRELCESSLANLYPSMTLEIQSRLNYELSVIEKMGYVDYFLIVWDFIRYAREHAIMVGPGRGSAAGSLVAYALGITKLDPLKYNLLFERFLNPERVSMPDIDIDFCFERRQEVIDYVVSKYGESSVVQIITFGTLQARGVIRDVGRVMDLPYAFVDQIAKLIPQELGITLQKSIEKNPDLRKAIDEDVRVRQLVEMGLKLEGLQRHSSVHAAGVVICEKPVVEYVPLSKGSDEAITTQFTMTTLEELGLLKMDFLGLRTLTVIQKTLENIKNTHHIEIDIDQIEVEDTKVYQSLWSGNSDGIFQLESAGMKEFMKALKPANMEDIIAGISLYRPGPMDFIPKYIQGKNQKESIEYELDALEDILQPTYGCIVYQEQVMQIVQKLAGYSLGQADMVRRAMSKKKEDVMLKERTKFVYGDEASGIEGCLGRGIDEKIANHIFDEMVDFAKYAFNKSHAAAYGLVSYQTAWLKYYYPVEFMAALLTSVIDNPTKVADYIYVCRNMNIEILPPDVNSSREAFSVEDGKIRYTLTSVKGIGKAVTQTIVKEREERGPFTDIQDFLTRLPKKCMNKRNIEHLILSGAFDSLSSNRRQLLLAQPQLMEEVEAQRKNTLTGQMSFLDFMQQDEKMKVLSLPEVEDFSWEQRLSNEKEVLGVYISGHPLQKVAKLLEVNATVTSDRFRLDTENPLKNQSSVIVGGMVLHLEKIFTKNNQQMAFVTLEDLKGVVEIIVFPRQFHLISEKLQIDDRIFVKGKVSSEEEKDSKVILEEIYYFDDLPKALWIQFETMDHYHSQYKTIESRWVEGKGQDDLIFYIKETKQMKKIPRISLKIEGEDLTELKDLVGEENVVLRDKHLEISH